MYEDAAALFVYPTQQASRRQLGQLDKSVARFRSPRAMSLGDRGDVLRVLELVVASARASVALVTV
jgi:hypothetical protein